jgi:hypothetical protein
MTRLMQARKHIIGDLSTLQFCTFSARDAAELEALHREVGEVTDPDLFIPRDQAFFEWVAEEGGWVIGYRWRGRVMSCICLLSDPIRFRDDWFFPRESDFLDLPLAWGTGMAVHPLFQANHISGRFFTDLEDFLEVHGLAGRLGVRHPRNMLQFRHYPKRVVIAALYYDHAGFNFLVMGLSRPFKDRLPGKAVHEVDLHDEHGHREALSAGYMGLGLHVEGDRARVLYG